MKRSNAKAPYYCEICGTPVFKPKYYKVEGVTMILCDRCAKYGEPVVRREFMPRKKRVLSHNKVIDRVLEKDWELVDDYGMRIRKARERLGWKLEELAMKIGEPVTFVRKLEANKLVPPDHVIEKLEKTLKIELRKNIDLEGVVDLEDLDKLGTVSYTHLTLPTTERV